jgi:endonuclease YncB( thermonuclease family)
LLLLGFGLVAPAGPAAALADGLEPGGHAAVVEVVDGDTLVLDDGREVRLVGIQAPKLPLGRPGFVAWPLAEAARDALAELATGRSVSLGYGGSQIDRHGRALAHLHVMDGPQAGLWLQGEMLARGLARVYSFADNRALVAEMLALEQAARQARRGIWTDPWYRMLTPGDLERELFPVLGSFQIVEGRVLDAAVVRKRGYLNFGEDWKTDFTVAIDPAALRLFEASGLDLDAYQGRRIRVRGWIKSFNGPMIEATHPEQIEVLEE